MEKEFEWAEWIRICFLFEASDVFSMQTFWPQNWFPIFSFQVKDIVISVPCYFVDFERRALFDAASVAGLNVLKLMNDTTATALAYGIYKQDLPAPEEKARNVIFVDHGHVGVQVSAASFNKGKLTMKACTFDRNNCGGKAFDAALVKYFADEFKAKTKLDPYQKPR